MSTPMKDRGFRLLGNPGFARQVRPPRSDPFPDEALREAREEIASWPGYEPTPLESLDGLAAACGIRSIRYKNEAERFGLGSFKALGGAYGVYRVLQAAIASRVPGHTSAGDLRDGRYEGLTSRIVVATATDGNHGRAVAWAACLFHCQCVVYLPDTCSKAREDAIRGYGARTVRTGLGYTESVRACANDAREQGHLVVSDTSWHGYESVPTLVMHGYTVMAREALEELVPDARPTHVFVQGGVGALAAAILGLLRSSWTEGPFPRFVVVEPEGAACLYASAAAGKPTPIPEAKTLMAGLACSEVSPLAWSVLASGVEFFATVSDSVVPECMKLLAQPPYGDIPIVAGESAIAGLAGLFAALGEGRAAERLGLDRQSRVLLFGTEGDTDPGLYRDIVGVSGAEVQTERRRWAASLKRTQGRR
jgi:diaminopropionate ammonia-lyase